MLTIHLSDFWTIGHNRGLTEGTRITLNWRKVGNLVCLSIRWSTQRRPRGEGRADDDARRSTVKADADLPRQSPAGRPSIASPGLRLFSALLVLGLVVSCISGVSQRRTLSSFFRTATVRPSGARVRYPGGWVDVPAGAVARQQTLHVRTAPRLPSTSSSTL